MERSSAALLDRPTRRSPSPRATIRVLHVINGEHYAGAERVHDLLAMRLPEFGVLPAFACVKPDRFAAARKSQRTPLVDVSMQSRFDLRPAWKLAHLIRGERIDLIHTHTPRAALVGNLAARLAGIPLVHHVHGQTVTEIGGGLRTAISAKVERWSLASAAAVIAVSPTAANYMASRGVAAEQIRLVPNGVPVSKHSGVRATPRDVWALGIVALFRPRKGLEVLLEALALLRREGQPVRLRAIGGFETADYENSARTLVKKLGLEQVVDWRGFQRDVDAELSHVDLAVLPSLIAEGMPMAVLEAMAAGVPTIGSNVDGIRDVIEHGHDGLLVEPGRPAALAAAVNDVIAGRHHWQELRRNAIQSHADHFSDTAMASHVANIYRSVLVPSLDIRH